MKICLVLIIFHQSSHHVFIQNKSQQQNWIVYKICISNWVWNIIGQLCTHLIVKALFFSLYRWNLIWLLEQRILKVNNIRRNKEENEHAQTHNFPKSPVSLSYWSTSDLWLIEKSHMLIQRQNKKSTTKWEALQSHKKKHRQMQLQNLWDTQMTTESKVKGFRNRLVAKHFIKSFKLLWKVNIDFFLYFLYNKYFFIKLSIFNFSCSHQRILKKLL